MRVKNIESYHGMTREAMEKLGTRHILSIMNSARSFRTCECCHVEQESDKPFNDGQCELRAMAKEVLASREHVKRGNAGPQHRHKEKKVMKY